MKLWVALKLRQDRSAKRGSSKPVSFSPRLGRAFCLRPQWHRTPYNYSGIFQERETVGIYLKTKEHLVRSKSKRWDGQWRVVTFDIPEKRRSTRDRLRGYMQAYGFKKLQSSVWVFPYDCEEVLALIKAELRIGNAVLYMVVDEIENDRPLREHFRLPTKH